MATNYPGSLDSYSTKNAADTIAEGHINDPQDAIEVIEAKVGTGADTPVSGDVLKGTGTGTSGWAVLTSTDMPAGSVVQVVNTMVSATTSGSTAMNTDDTTPEKTEGTEFMTLAITPTSTTNKLVIDIVFNGAVEAAQQLIVALFQDTTTNALAAVIQGAPASAHCVHFIHYMVAGTTSATTFKVRAGTASTTVYFNGNSGGRLFGGVSASSITITEIKG